MSQTTTLPLEGGCRCGQLRFRIDAAPLFTAACHCTGCQRMSASAFSLTVAVPEGGFTVTEGEAVLGGLLDPALQHLFCPSCKSWVYTRPAGAGFVNVRPTMLDDPRWFVPFIETYTSEKLPWANTPATHRFERFPPPEAYAGLLAEYAERNPVR